MSQLVSAAVQEPDFDPRGFRDALGCFATGITIVTARSESGEACGVTIGSFGSLSLDPPLVLWSLTATSSSYAAFAQATYFMVHVLAEDQGTLAQRFARSGADRFAGLDLVEGPHGIPIIPDVAARFECRMLNGYPGGDHVIFIGRVLDFLHWPHRPPLVFHRGGMRRLADAGL